jgi:hypothetical protein
MTTNRLEIYWGNVGFNFKIKSGISCVYLGCEPGTYFCHENVTNVGPGCNAMIFYTTSITCGKK